MQNEFYSNTKTQYFLRVKLFFVNDLRQNTFCTFVHDNYELNFGLRRHLI